MQELDPQLPKSEVVYVSLCKLADLVRTANSSGLLLLYPDLSRAMLSLLMAKAFTRASVKLGTKTCLQNDAYPSTRSLPYKVGSGEHSMHEC